MFGDVLTATADGPGPGDRLTRAVARLDSDRVGCLADLAESLATDPTALTGTELLAGAVAFDRVRNRFDAANHRLHAALDDSLAYAADGARSGAAWLNANTCVSAKSAGIGLALSRNLRAGFPAVNESFHAGRIGESKVRLLVKARKPDVETYFDWMEPMLVAEVEERTVEAAALFLVSWRYRLLELLAQNDSDQDPNDGGELSHVHLSRILDGRLVLDGQMDTEDAAIVTGAIEAKIDSWFHAGLLTGDTRSRAELQAAALVELIQQGADPTRSGGALRPLCLVTIDADTIVERADQARRRRTRIEDIHDRQGVQSADRECGPGDSGGDAGVDDAWPDRCGRHPSAHGRNFSRSPRSRRGPANRPDAIRSATTAAPKPPKNNRSTGSGPIDRSDPPNLHHIVRRLGFSPQGTDPPRPPGVGPPKRTRSLYPFPGSDPPMVARSEIVGFGPVPVAVIERLLCTADISRVLTRGTSEILDVGRTFRLATNAQRRALVVRSGGTCEWPGCTVTHTWCDAHHLTPWEDNGSTDLQNLTQICKHHHRQFHHHNYVGINSPDGLHVYRQDGTEITALLETH